MGIVTPIQHQEEHSEKELKQDELILLKMMEQNLEGVMYHSFETDFYDLLKLDGFKLMHEYQAKEENENLKDLKNKYIKCYKKLPQLEIQKENNYWKDYSDLTRDKAKEKLPELVKMSMKSYADWETEVLEHLLKWKRDFYDREIFHSMIKEVMKEIEQIETLINILEEHNYHVDCICEISDFLFKRYYRSV